MSGWSRAFFGAALGSLITLIIHPISRPVVLGYWNQPSSLVLQAPNRYVSGESNSLPQPRSLEDASTWVQAGSDRQVSGQRRTREELAALLKIVDAAAHAEPENAFWRQISAVYLRELGRNEAAKKIWFGAQGCKSWNDYQSNRLVRLQNWLGESSRIRLSWQSNLAYLQRSAASVREIESFSRWLLSSAGMNLAPDLLLRLSVLRNSSLLIDGSRAISVGRVGEEMFDLACNIKPGGAASRKERYDSRYLFKSKVQEILGDAAAEEVEAKLRHAEAWSVFTSTDPAIQNPLEVLDLSSMTGALPGTLLMIGLCGAVLYLVGTVAVLWPARPSVKVPVLSLIAISLGWASAALVKLPMVGLLVVMAVLFQIVTPVEADRRRLKSLGTLFELAVTVFAVSLIVVLGIYFFGDIAPGASTLLLIGVPPEYLFGSSILAGIAIVILCLVLVVPPTWALSHRVQTSQVIRLMFQRLGSILVGVCIPAAIVLTPIMLMLDRGLTDKMDKLLENEPLYYVNP